MNKIYNVVWSEARRAWVVTSELAAGSGIPRQLKRKRLSGLVAVCMMQVVFPALAVDYSGEILGNGLNQNLYGGDTATSTTINGGAQFISGGNATSTTINRGFQVIYSGGSATVTAIYSDGYQYVYPGGSAIATTVNDDGFQVILSGGSATSTTVNNRAWQYVQFGGSATSTTVNNSGLQYVTSGGSAMATTVNSGGSQVISSGGNAIFTTVNNSGYQTIYSGGSATSTTINTGSQLISGGNAIFTTVNDGGYQTIYSGGSATSTTINTGSQLISGGNATSTTVNGGGGQAIYSGGSATSTTVNNGGYQYVYSGGSATSATINTGFQLISGGNAIFTTVNNGGYQYVYSGGSATSTTVNNSGVQYILSGGSAASTIVNSGGSQAIFSGGSATATTVNSGGQLVVNSGGVLSGTTTLTEGGRLSGGNVINNGNLVYEYNSSASYSGNLTGSGEIVQNGGRLTLSGTLDQDRVNLNSAGTLVLDALQATVDIIAQSGTEVYLTNGTVLTGTIDPTNLVVASSAIWDMTDDASLDTLNVAGSINMKHDSGAFTPMTLTTTNITGSGGSITLHSVLGDTSSLTDQVVIDGGKATGTTNLFIINEGGLGAPTTGLGIAVVKAINGGTTDSGAFGMKDPLDVGSYRYSLLRNADQNWYLTSTLLANSTGGTDNRYSNAAWLYTALPVQSMDYERQVLGDKDSRRSVVFADKQTGREIWGRMRAGHLTHDRSGVSSPGEGQDSRSDYAFVQIGGDVAVLESDNAQWRTGIYGAAGSNRGEVSRGDDQQSAGTFDDAVYTAGLYLNAAFNRGFYLDNILQVSRHRLTTATAQDTTMQSRGTGFAASLEGGWPLQVWHSVSIEPQVQYLWQTLDLDDATDRSGTTFSAGDNQLHQVRVGARIGNQAATQDVTDNLPVSFWVKPSLLQSFNSRNEIAVGVSGRADTQVSFNPDQNGTALLAEAGADIAVGKHGTLGVRGGYMHSVDGNAADGYYGQLNMKIRF
ncbi:autotransporter outer membrane beta-barrel domain-containing protein [Kluyvera sichuanensis]|uniref:autotransporter outer membrane beta-barrel domain-containing protein n=1 Tax=Kluyvera sichuanensis TaxID=2725494 RepID=UPI0039F70DEA